MYKISSLFGIVNMGILACETCPKITFLDPEHTGPNLLNYSRSDPSETIFKLDISW